MKMNKQNSVTEKFINRNAEKTKKIPKILGDKTPMFLSLHLDGIIEGLELAFCVETKKDENQDSFMVIALNGKPLGCYETDWSECVSQKNGTLLINAELIGNFIPDEQHER